MSGGGVCEYCQISPSIPSSLLLCSGCRAVRYCSRDHQKSDWKDHKIKCQAKSNEKENNNQTNHVNDATSAITKNGIPTSILSTTTPIITDGATTTAVTMKTPPVERVDNMISVAGPWCDVLFDRCCELKEDAANLLQSQQPSLAIPILTHALYLHAALLPEYPNSILHLLYGHRSIAYLSLQPPPSPFVYLAIYDALTSIKVNRDYVHGYGLAYNAYKAAGRYDKAKDCASQGIAASIKLGDDDLKWRFSGMIDKLDQEEKKKAEEEEQKRAKKKKGKKNSLSNKSSPSSSASSVTPSDPYSKLLIEAKNLREKNVHASKESWNKFDSAVRSSVSQTLYHLPPLAKLQSLYPCYKYVSLRETFVNNSAFYDSLTKNKGIEVAYSPSLGRHLIATRHYNVGEIVIRDTPALSSSMNKEMCAVCYKSLEIVNNRCLNGIPCVNGCYHEFYCSPICRDRAWLRHHQWLCGHHWTELRDRCREAVTGSAKTYLILGQAMGVTMGVIKGIEREIRSTAIKIATKKKNNEKIPEKSTTEGEQKVDKENETKNSPFSLALPTDPFHNPFNLLNYIPTLSQLQSHTDLPASFLQSTSHQFDRQWAMLTLMTHWFILSPPHVAGSLETDIETITKDITKSGSEEKKDWSEDQKKYLLPSYSSSSAQSFLPYFSYELFDSLHSRLLLNSYSLHTTHSDPNASVGGSIISCSILASLFTHSCFPNVALSMDAQVNKGQLVFRASRVIKKGDLLCVSYIDEVSLKGKKKERAEGLLTYGFKCHCNRCTREKEEEKEELELKQFYQQHGLV